MTRLQTFEFWVRIIAWLGAWLLETVTVWERISEKEYPIFTIIALWTIVSATYLAGIFDLSRFRGEKRKMMDLPRK